MNIAIDARILGATFRGGILVYTERLVEHLSRIDHSNRYQLLFSGLRLRPESIRLDVGENFQKSVLRVPDRQTRASSLLWRYAALPAYFATHRTDIYHLPAMHEMTSARRVKKIFTIHDLRSTHLSDVEPQNLDHMRRSARRSDRIIAVSHFTRRDIVRVLRIPDHKVSTVHLGVDEDYRLVEPARVDALRERLGLRRPYLLSLGLMPRKNIERLIRAYARLPQRRDVDLLLAGHPGGPWVTGYRALIRQLGLEEHVRLPGAVPLPDLVTLYNGALAFVFPSLLEGFGIPVLEAMACGAPVLTSNLSALPEVAGDAALLVDPYSEDEILAGMERLTADDALRAELSRRGRERAGHFTWERMAREILAVYASL